MVKRNRGFSLTELVVTLAVGLVLIAVGLPAFLRAYHSYELSSAAVQVADILRLARYEAIRLNKPVGCIIGPSTTSAGMTNLWVDSNGNGQLDVGEKVILLGGSGNLVDGGTVPNTGGLVTNAIGSVSYSTPSSTSAEICFDARGALSSLSGANVCGGPPTSVNVFYLASTLAPEAGFRSVVLMPAGSIQIWTSDANGNWQQQR